MKRSVSIFFLVGLHCSLGGVPAMAQNLTGNELLDICTSGSEDLARLGYCAGYVSGVIEGMKWGAAALLMLGETPREDVEALSSSLLGFCNPEGVTLGQHVGVVTKHLQDNPAERHASARVIVQTALQDAFPCF